MATTYCTTADVEALLSEHGLTAFVDDDETGARGTAGAGYISDCIERAAVTKINPRLEMRYYPLSAIASNAWCKWANATCAALYASTRRNQPAPPTLMDEWQAFENMLLQIVAGSAKLPEQADTHDMRPVVTNYDVERGRRNMPVRKVLDRTTGPPQHSHLKQHPAYPYHKRY